MRSNNFYRNKTLMVLKKEVQVPKLDKRSKGKKGKGGGVIPVGTRFVMEEQNLNADSKGKEELWKPYVEYRGSHRTADKISGFVQPSLAIAQERAEMYGKPNMVLPFLMAEASEPVPLTEYDAAITHTDESADNLLEALWEMGVIKQKDLDKAVEYMYCSQNENEDG